MKNAKVRFLQMKHRGITSRAEYMKAKRMEEEWQNKSIRYTLKMVCLIHFTIQLCEPLRIARKMQAKLKLCWSVLIVQRRWRRFNMEMKRPRGIYAIVLCKKFVKKAVLYRRAMKRQYGEFGGLFLKSYERPKV